jgi:hypothetical protein
MRENLDGFRKLFRHEDADMSEEELEIRLDLLVCSAEAFNTGDRRERERIVGVLDVTFRGDGLTVR